MAETLTKTAVIGSPINHSLSPSIHNYWIKKNKIKTDVYQKIKIDALELNKKIHNLINDNFIGLNVTIPVKELADNICEELSETSKKLKAVNTLTFKKGKVIGINTDPKGFINSIDDKTKNVRQNVHNLYMVPQKKIISLAKQAGFILKGKVNMVLTQYEYQYLYLMYKPE